MGSFDGERASVVVVEAAIQTREAWDRLQGRVCVWEEAQRSFRTAIRVSID